MPLHARGEAAPHSGGVLFIRIGKAGLFGAEGVGLVVYGAGLDGGRLSHTGGYVKRPLLSPLVAPFGFAIARLLYYTAIERTFYLQQEHPHGNLHHALAKGSATTQGQDLRAKTIIEMLDHRRREGARPGVQADDRTAPDHPELLGRVL